MSTIGGISFPILSVCFISQCFQNSVDAVIFIEGSQQNKWCIYFKHRNTESCDDLMKYKQRPLLMCPPTPQALQYIVQVLSKLYDFFLNLTINTRHNSIIGGLYNQEILFVISPQVTQV